MGTTSVPVRKTPAPDGGLGWWWPGPRRPVVGLSVALHRAGGLACVVLAGRFLGHHATGEAIGHHDAVSEYRRMHVAASRDVSCRHHLMPFRR